MLFLVRCPKCKHPMKYQSPSRILTGKSKQCVYCGRSFRVKNNLVKEL